MRTKEWTVRQTFQPAAVGVGETKALFNVKKGWRVISASRRIDTNAAATTDSTMTLGDGDDTDGFITAIDLELATGIGDGAGAYFANAGGKLYLVDDTIDVVYAGVTFGATNPKVTFTVTIRDERY